MKNQLANTAGGALRRLKTSRKLHICLVSFVWFGCIVVGYGILLSHDTESVPLTAKSTFVFGKTIGFHDGITAKQLQQFVPGAGQVRIVMALHPKCPCTRRSLDELQSLLGIAPEKTHCTFLVGLPSSKSKTWMDTDTVATASGLPNVDIITDQDSARAKSLGLSRSGESLVINDAGQVVFQSGITAGRSCKMRNPSSDAVSEFLLHGTCPAITTPMFGCPLR